MTTSEQEAAPTVLILGGYLTSPFLYRRLASRLTQRGAAAVIVAPLWTPDWVLGTVRGLGHILAAARRSLGRAERMSVEVSGGRPVLVVGHSGGGFIARLLTSPQPFLDLQLDRRRSIGAIVTLGTPHQVPTGGLVAGRIGRLAATFANDVVPGAFFAPEVGYVAVGSRFIVGGGRLLSRGRFAGPLYRRLHPAPDRSPIDGDGLVPLACTDLPGSRRVVLENVIHGPLAGRAWYGSVEGVDVWWPVALEAWRDALVARGAAEPGAPNATEATR